MSGGAKERLAVVTGVRELDEVEHEVARLEVAVAENRHLEALLEPQVARLERAVAGLLGDRPGRDES